MPKNENKVTRYKETEERINPLEGVALEPGAIAPLRLVHTDNINSIWLFQGDCLEVLDSVFKKYPDGCFDMIFADPPYFLSNGGITCRAGQMVKVDKGDWDKSRGPELNHEFNSEWLRRCQRVLKPNGTIWVTGTHHVIFSIGFAMQQLGFKILNDISWEKPNPPPNLSCRYFTHSTETVIWAAKNEQSKHTFNYGRMRGIAGGKQMKSVWRIFPPLNGEKTLGKHPTQKPVALVERCILASTRKGDLVLDPFMGAGTTGVACVLTKRRFVGIELDAQYVKLAVKRISNHAASPDLVAVSAEKVRGVKMRLLKNTVRPWLIEYNYNDIAELIDEITASWAQNGKGTRRNWWDILAGDKEGNPRVVEGRKFPVLRAARIRQNLSITKGSLSRNDKEVIPPVIEQARWKGHSKG